MAEKASSEKSNRLSLSIDLRWICIALLAAIAVMFIIWKPWDTTPHDSRTVQVTGDSKLTAKPDEFVFSPSYEFKNADKSAALTELNKKSDEITAKLKSLGVDDSKIKTDSTGYDYPIYYDESNDATYDLDFTITVNDLSLAQKVQDYLLTTSPNGSVSPTADFSDSKRKQLENKARDEATKDARSKGERMAKNLGFKLGKVKTIDDSDGFGDVMPVMGMHRGMSAAEDTQSGSSSLAVQPGENDLEYSVTVTYFIK